MNLHGDLADPELKSNLLIEHTRDHKTHDLALARTQGRVGFSQPSKVTLLTARHAVAIQSLVDRIQQVLVFERLGQKLHSTRFHGLHCHWNISMTGNENDRNSDARVSQLPLKVETIDSRKAYVQNKAARAVRPLAA